MTDKRQPPDPNAPDANHPSDHADPNDPDPDFRAPSQLPTEPWMRWAGTSFPASIVVWLRSPKSIRRITLGAAFYAMLLFAAVVAAVAGVMWLVAWGRGG